MIRSPIAIALVALCLLGSAGNRPAAADMTTPDTAGGRYMFEQQPDGLLRLDTQTGEVALCSQRAVGWACVAAPEDRAVLEGEIVRLRAENAALKKEVLSRGLPLPPGANPESGTEPPTAQHSVTLPLPSDADIERMVVYAGQLWHRFIDAVERAQKQVFSNS